MLLSVCDLELLKLLCWCKSIPVGAGAIFTNIYTHEDIKFLKYLGLVSMSADKNTIRPRQEAYDILSGAGIRYEFPESKSPTNSRMLERRNIAAQILHTFHTAGISVFNDSLPGFISEPIYVASFAARNRDKGNPFGSTRFHGIFCTAQEAFVVYYVDGFGMHHQNELALFHGFTKITGIRNTAIIMMGTSTSEISESVLNPQKENREKSAFRTDTFARVFETTTLPVHFIPLGDAGSQTLMFMINPDYRNVVAKAVLGKLYKPPYKNMPYSDAVHPTAPNNPGIVAVDMDIKRIDYALENAKNAGFEKISLYALKEQMPFLRERYKERAEIFGVNIDVIKNTIGFDIEIKKPENRAFITNDGRCFNASDIAAYRKAGKQA